MRATLLHFRSPKEYTAEQNNPQITTNGGKLPFDIPKFKSKTFGQDKRFNIQDILAERSGSRVSNQDLPVQNKVCTVKYTKERHHNQTKLLNSQIRVGDTVILDQKSAEINPKLRSYIHKNNLFHRESNNVISKLRSNLSSREKYIEHVSAQNSKKFIQQLDRTKSFDSSVNSNNIENSINDVKRTYEEKQTDNLFSRPQSNPTKQEILKTNEQKNNGCESIENDYKIYHDNIGNNLKQIENSDNDIDENNNSFFDYPKKPDISLSSIRNSLSEKIDKKSNFNIATNAICNNSQPISIKSLDKWSNVINKKYQNTKNNNFNKSQIIRKQIRKEPYKLKSQLHQQQNINQLFDNNKHLKSFKINSNKKQKRKLFNNTVYSDQSQQLKEPEIISSQAKENANILLKNSTNTEENSLQNMTDEFKSDEIKKNVEIIDKIADIELKEWAYTFDHNDKR